MKPTELCQAISKGMVHLPEESQVQIKRTYEKTWLLVCYFNESLAVPTASGCKRLADLLNAVRNEGKRLGVAYFG